MHIDNNKLVVIEPKTFNFHFDLSKDIDKNLKCENDSNIIHNAFLAEQRIKMRLTNYCTNINMETIFMNTENSKTNEPQKLVLSLTQRLDLKNSDKYVGLQNLSINYTWKTISQQYKKNKLKIITPTWNNEFELPDGSYSLPDIQNYIEHIMKKHGILSNNPSFHIYTNRIINWLVLKIKDRYKLELQTPETMILFGTTKILIDKTKNEENVPILEAVRVVLVQCNLVDNQYVAKVWGVM